MKARGRLPGSVLSLWTALCVTAAASAWAQEFPSRPIRWVVPASAGAGADILMRVIGAKVTERTGWTIFVENRPGGNFSVAIANLLQAPADGYTVLQGFMSFTILPHTSQKLEWDLRDLQPVSRVADTPSIVTVHSSIPAQNIKELVAWSKANPGKLSFAGVGIGSTSHLNAEMLRWKFGLDFTYVSYANALAISDQVAGRAQAGYNAVSDVAEPIRAGKLKPILLLSARRTPLFPDMPTAVEQTGDADFDSATWYSFYVKAGTPMPIVDRWAREINTAADQKDVREKIVNTGALPLAVMEGPAEFRKKQDADFQKWGSLIKTLNLKFNN